MGDVESDFRTQHMALQLHAVPNATTLWLHACCEFVPLIWLFEIGYQFKQHERQLQLRA
jgi:hypothetical protein